MTRRLRRRRAPSVVVIWTEGVLYLRIDRLPRWILAALPAALSALGTWLFVRG